MSDLGRHDEALREADAALRVNPVSVYGEVLKAHFEYQARHYDIAAEGIRRALELEPHYWVARITLRRCGEQRAVQAGDPVFKNATEGSGASSEGIALAGYTYGVSGRPVRLVSACVTRNHRADQVRPSVVPALVYQGLGDSNEALRWLERAYDERDVHMVFLGVDPKWDPLREDPRFIRLVKRMKLPQ